MAIDVAQAILASAPTDNDTKAQAWDAFHNSSSADDLTASLQNLKLPNDIKADLWDAKNDPERFALSHPNFVPPPSVPMPSVDMPQGNVYQSVPQEATPEGNAAAVAQREVQHPVVSTLGHMAIGAGKGALETAGTIGKAITNPIVKQVFSPEDVAKSDQNLQQATTANGAAEKVGKIGESVAEFVLGDGALKGMSIAERLGLAQKVAKLAEESPVLANILDHGLNSIRGGVVAGGQTLAHGGSATDALENAGKVGLIGTGLGAAGETISAAGQQLANKVTPATSLVAESGLPLEEGANGSKALQISEVGKNLQTGLKATRTAAGEAVGAAKTAAYGSPDATITLGHDSPLYEQVTKSLDELPGDNGLDSLKTPETEKLRDVLTELKTKLESGWEGTQSDVNDLRSGLKQEASRLNTLKQMQGIGGSEAGVYKQLVSSLNDSESQAISDQLGGPEAASNLSAANKNLAQVAGRQERGLTKAILKSPQPSTVIDSLARGNISPEKVTAITQDIAPAGQTALRNGVLKRLEEMNTSNNSVDWGKVASTIEKKPQAWQQLLGPQYKGYVTRVMQEATKQRYRTLFGDLAKGAAKKVAVGAGIGAGYEVAHGLLKQVEVHADPVDADADVNTANIGAPRPTDALPSAVEDKMQELYLQAAPSFQLPNAKEEHSFTYNKFGNPGTISTSREAMKNSVTILPGVTSGIVHSHPMQSKPQPSTDDVEIARKTKLPNYVLSQRELWVALPDGTSRQVANVTTKGGKVQINYIGTK